MQCLRRGLSQHARPIAWANDGHERRAPGWSTAVTSKCCTLATSSGSNGLPIERSLRHQRMKRLQRDSCHRPLAPHIWCLVASTYHPWFCTSANRWKPGRSQAARPSTSRRALSPSIFAVARQLVAHGRRASALQRDCLLSGGHLTRLRGSSEPPAATESDPGCVKSLPVL